MWLAAMERPAIWETAVAVRGGQVSAQEPEGQRNGYARFTLGMYIMQHTQGFSKRKNCSVKCNLIMVVNVGIADLNLSCGLK